MKVAILDVNWNGKHNFNQCINECEIINVCDLDDVDYLSIYSKERVKNFIFTVEGTNYIMSVEAMSRDKIYNEFIRNVNYFEKNQRKEKLKKLKSYDR